MTASALRGETPTPDRLGKVMRDVVNGTVEAMDAAMPPAFRSDRLREAVDALTAHVERIAHETRAMGRSMTDPVTRAAREAAAHPADVARDSMHAGVRAAAGAASRLMAATGGVISGVAEGIAEASERKG